ncbi:MAG: hypothetical protein ACRDKE_08915, partial [Solirubrobacterales bacterium]
MKPTYNLRGLAVSISTAFLSFAQITCSAGAAASVEVVPTSDPRAVELVPVISGWRASVSARDDKRIVEFALPEFQGVIARDLESDSSALSKALYSGSTALALFFERPLRWVILRHPEFEKSGRGTTTCYYDPSLLDDTKVREDAALIGV